MLIGDSEFRNSGFINSLYGRSGCGILLLKGGICVVAF
jgi:hypothetical protein